MVQIQQMRTVSTHVVLRIRVVVIIEHIFLMLKETSSTLVILSLLQRLEIPEYISLQQMLIQTYLNDVGLREIMSESLLTLV